jgi:hypothetical protein
MTRASVVNNLMEIAGEVAAAGVAAVEAVAAVVT